jgi:hypothetical protein
LAVVRQACVCALVLKNGDAAHISERGPMQVLLWIFNDEIKENAALYHVCIVYHLLFYQEIFM